MNKQELIKEVKEIGIYGLNIFGTVVEGIPTKTTIKLIEQLDEPEKVTISQSVAEYIEQKKNEDYHLLGAMTEIRSHKNKGIDAWFYTDDNIELFARAWLDGYEVEKKPKYIVKLKNGQPLVRAPLRKNFYFNQNITAGKYKATRKELEEAGFGWVFSCEGIEVEEVEE